MASQQELDLVFVKMAFTFSELSKANRRKVGCIIVKDGQVISNGFNGTPSGFDNSCEIDNVTKPEVLHAESNALMKLAQSTNSSKGATLYLTCAPCFDCSKLIIQAGISRVVYTHNYRKEDGLDLLSKTNVIVDRYII